MNTLKVIFDIDGTLSNCQHRRYLAEEGDFKSFEYPFNILQDEPNHTIIDVLRMFRSQGYPIVITSGRNERAKDVTIEWLKKHNIRYDELYMRGQWDSRPDHEVKKEFLDKIGKNSVYCVFDDRDSVVKMWREQGLTCFQVAEGNF